MPPRVRILAVLFAVNCLNIYDRQVLGALAEPVRREFGLSDMQIGALSTLFTLVYAVAGLPLGRLADRISRRILLAAGVAFWGALTALGGFAGSYAALLASRVGVAVGEAVCAPAATSWIGDLFPPQARARALATFMLGVPLGVGLSAAVCGPIGQTWGWRAAMLLAAAPALVLAPALLAMPEGRRETAAKAAAASPWVLLRIPAFPWIIASGALVNFTLYTVSTFLPAYLSRWHGLSVAQAGLWVGIGSGAAGLAGGLAAGAWGSRRSGAAGRLQAASIASALAVHAALAGIAIAPGGALFAIILLTAAYGLWNMYYGLVYAAIQDLVGPGLRATAMALYFMAMYLCGAAFGPLVTGRLSDLLAHQAAGGGPLTEAARAAGLHNAMYVIPVLSAALALVLARAARRVVRQPGGHI